MIKIYHNNSCSKSRCALTILEESGRAFELINYLEIPPNAAELIDIIKKLNLRAYDLVRKTDVIYIEKYKGKDLSEAEWITAMIKDPILIERPIIISGDCVIIARPVERIYDIINID